MHNKAAFAGSHTGQLQGTSSPCRRALASPICLSLDCPQFIGRQQRRKRLPMRLALREFGPARTTLLWAHAPPIASAASMSCSMLHIVGTTPAAVAGVVRSVWWRRQRL